MMGCGGKNSDDGRNDNVEMGDKRDGKNRGGKWGKLSLYDSLQIASCGKGLLNLMKFGHHCSVAG